ncbi:hypothetical protein CC80DRAFT_477768 [Byssothecium circinans]|uniref:C2H2-type domain-containing protein n=1 Tax=Byssothecium circinans TaxID=147558 RepID=A0A6A5TKU4_9PLEO|nr:hypothetical protein CC80DRAFT_477768 [Byssothecium circinans]
MSSPNSDILSDYASDDFPEDVKPTRRLSHTPDHDPSPVPNKRLRLTTRADRAPSSPPRAAKHPIEVDDLGALSEDTDGSVPASPHHPGMSADDDFGQDQVSVCKWEGCEAGDLENMDNLVEHLHEDHIGTRQKKYSCEWSDCPRKGIPHASGYALRAHMRSHTREKPFYCTLPECDRSFTRSDALAKHMRTVHETEALRPSDPVPKHHSSNPTNKQQRLKLVLTAEAKRSTDKGSTPASPASHAPNSATIPQSEPNVEYAHNNVIYIEDVSTPNAPKMVQFPPDLSFTPRELSLPAPELFKLLRLQLHWATQEGESLRAEAESLEKKRKDEWVAKELLVENLMEAEVAKAKRGLVEAGNPDIPHHLALLNEDVEPSRKLRINAKDRKLPWWRDDSWTDRLDNSMQPDPGTSLADVRPDDVVATAEK